MKEKTVPQIICDCLGSVGETIFMPEVWREGCGAVFLSGKIGGEGGGEWVGFELAVRCGETAEDRNNALRILKVAGERLADSPPTVNGVTGFVSAVTGARMISAGKDGVAEYRAEYRLRYAVSADVQEKSVSYYINTGSSHSPKWSRMSAGICKLEESRETELQLRRYYHESVRRALSCGYSSAVSFEAELSSDSAAAVFLADAVALESAGEETVAELLTVMESRELSPGVLCAIMREYSVVGDGYKNNGGSLCACGRLVGRGVAVRGRFVSSTGTFTKDN